MAWFRCDYDVISDSSLGPTPRYPTVIFWSRAKRRNQVFLKTLMEHNQWYHTKCYFSSLFPFVPSDFRPLSSDHCLLFSAPLRLCARLFFISVCRQHCSFYSILKILPNQLLRPFHRITRPPLRMKSHHNPLRKHPPPQPPQ